jgi:hypothetical protein
MERKITPFPGLRQMPALSGFSSQDFNVVLAIEFFQVFGFTECNGEIHGKMAASSDKHTRR